MPKPAEFTYIGTPRKSVEGDRKVRGIDCYTSDYTVPGCLHARPILSPYAHARIVGVDKSAALEVDGVTHVLTADDLPTRDQVIKSRGTCTLAGDVVRFVGQPVAVVVAESAEAAANGAELVAVEYEEFAAIANFVTATNAEAAVLWPDGLPGEGSIAEGHAEVDDDSAEPPEDMPKNVHLTHHHSRGDVAVALAAADAVAHRQYATSRVHQGYIEPQVCTVVPDRRTGGVTIYAPIQGPLWARDAIAAMLGLKPHLVRIEVMTVGGGFGSKNGILEPLVAAVALAINRPVTCVLSRTEDFLTTTPSSGCTWDMEIGAATDGTITALRAAIRMDAGAFASGLGSLVALLLGSYYRFPNLQIDVEEVNTTTPHCGPYRAPGAPQAIFALESTIDEVAAKLGMDPLEFRIQNCVVTGDPMYNDELWPSVGIRECLEAMREHPAWKDRDDGPNEGTGIALAIWPGGHMPSATICRVGGDGIIRLHIGSPDISGTHSSQVLVAAETIGVSPDQIEIITGDTESNPHSAAAAGSLVTYSLTGAVIAAAERVREQLLNVAAEKLEAHIDDLLIKDGIVHVSGVPGVSFTIAELAADAQSGTGPIIADGQSGSIINAPAATVQLVKVNVDSDTGAVTPLNMVAVQDVGRAINPLMVEGQIHGGAIQGVGWAFHEAMIYDDDGQLLTSSFIDYDLPKAHHAPTLETVLLENASPSGPLGVRCVGEPPIIPGAAAAANAVRQACGARVTQLPMRPEVVWNEIHNGTDT